MAGYWDPVSEDYKNPEDYVPRSVLQDAKVNIPKMDEEELMKTARMSSYPALRILAIEQIKDQQFLTEIAIHEQLWYVAEEAVKKVTQKDLLSKIIITAHSSKIRYRAFDRVYDEETLKALLYRVQDKNMRRSIVERLYDQEELYRLAKRASDRQLRIIAVRRLYNPDMLQSLLQTESDIELLSQVVKRISNRRVLMEISQNHPISIIREKALERKMNLTATADSSFERYQLWLADGLPSADESDTEEWKIFKQLDQLRKELKDLSDVTDIQRNSLCQLKLLKAVREIEVVRKALSEFKEIEHIFNQEGIECCTRLIQSNKIKDDQALFTWIAIEAKCGNFRKIAAETLNQITNLKHVLKQSSDEAVKRIVQSRIQQLES